jgi:hypothetical protein
MQKILLSLLLLCACGGAPSAGGAAPPSYSYASSPINYGGGAAGDSAPAPMSAPAKMDREEVYAVQTDVPSRGASAKAAPVGPPPPPPQGTVPAQAQAQQKQQQKDNAAATETPHETAMLIYTANLTMAVYQVEPALNAIEKVGKDVGGYLAVRSDTAITIRVPREKFSDALAQVEKTGDVVHREVTAEDVTDQFIDLDARLRNAMAMRDRLQDLLKKANTKEALEIEIQLERVMGEIESMEGKLKLLKDKIAFSMITVTFAARGEAAVRDMPLRLPFPWLNSLGLPRLLSL